MFPQVFGGDAATAVSKASLTSVLLGYIASLALVASIGAWAVYLTGLVYRQLEPPVPVVSHSMHPLIPDRQSWCL